MGCLLSGLLRYWLGNTRPPIGGRISYRLYFDELFGSEVCLALLRFVGFSAQRRCFMQGKLFFS